MITRTRHLHTLLFALLLIAPAPARAVIVIPDNTTVGTWDAVERVFALTQDLGEEVRISEDNLTLDGNGHLISGSEGHGLNLSSRSGLIIRNLRIEGFYYGMLLHNCDDNTITGVDISGQQSYGILLHAGTSDNTVTDCTITGAYGIGVDRDSDRNRISGNTLHCDHGIVVGGSHDCELVANEISPFSAPDPSVPAHESPWGIRLSVATGTTVSENAIDGHQGVWLFAASNNELVGNTVSGGYGFWIHRASLNNQVTSNDISATTTGVLISEGSNGNQITLNDIAAARNGVTLYNTVSDNTIDRNTIRVDSESFGAGQYFNAAGIDFSWRSSANTASGNRIEVVALARSNSVLAQGVALSWDGNTVSGNTIAVTANSASDLYGSEGVGIQLRSSGNHLVGNSITAVSTTPWWRGRGIGINFHGFSGSVVNENTVSGNTIADCNDRGILISGSVTRNEIYNNNFLRNGSNPNGAQARSDTPGNIFSVDRPDGGNHWSDHTGPDADGDGFVDVPYEIVGTPGVDAVDQFPWVLADGWENVPPVADAGDDQLVIVGAEALLDGSDSSDPDGDPLSHAWSIVSAPVGSLAELANAGTATPSLVPDVPGDYLIQLVVNDGSLYSDPDAVTVTAQTPQEATEDIVAEVQGLIDTGILNNGNGNALTSKLENIIGRLEKKNVGAAANQLGAFINQVQALVSSGRLSVDEAQPLIDAAEAIIAHLGGRGTKVVALPDGFSLSAAEPNPFNPTTTIRYSLPEASDVRLVIYNVLGQRVRVLVNGGRKAGTHRVSWDGRDAFGREAGSGVYFYRIQAGVYSTAQKMVLAR